jgi:phosphoheptose isomerase
MRDLSSILQHAIDASVETLRSLGELDQPLRQAVDLVAQSLTAGHKILVCGNGGSAADAADFTTEFACRFVHDRPPYFALNLSAGGSLLTAIGNDYGFEEIFARQVAAFGRPGDVLIGITTSGRSPNVRRALEEAKSRELGTIALLGRDGGVTKGIAQIELIVRGDFTARIQEAHKVLLHVICEAVEERLPRQ